MQLGGRVAMLLVLLGAAPAAAATVDFAFGGYVQSVLDTHGVLDGSIAADTRLGGYARYETDLPDFLLDPTIGGYAQPIPPGVFVVDVGSYTIEVPSPMTLYLYDDFGMSLLESFGWRFEGGTLPIPGAPGASFNAVLFRMDTPDTSLFSSDALPAAPLDIADFPNREITRFSITGCLDTELSGYLCVPNETIQIHGIIDTVPEPSAGAGALAALAALAALRRVARRLRPA